MKKAICAVLAAALVFALAGCGSSQTENSAVSQEAIGRASVSPPSTSQETGSEAPGQSSSALFGEAPESISAASGNSAEDSIPASQAPEASEESTSKARSSAAPQESKPPATTPPTAEQPPASTPTPESEAPEPTSPAEPEAPTPTEPEAPSFDIGYWISYGKQYGTGIGLKLDTATTACWDNPITAGAHSKYLQRDIQDTLDWYLSSGFQYFWIWAESQGDGTYLYYIGYA